MNYRVEVGLERGGVGREGGRGRKRKRKGRRKEGVRVGRGGERAGKRGGEGKGEGERVEEVDGRGEAEIGKEQQKRKSRRGI